MNKIEQEFDILKLRIRECEATIRTHKAEVGLLEGEILGLRCAIERLEPVLTNTRQP